MKEAGLQPHVQQEHIYWKYWQERADWPGSRSFVLTNGSELFAHAAVVPGVCRRGATRWRVLHMIDWAARRGEVGAGVLLMKHVGRLADFLLGIGGSAYTRRIMPLIGYRSCGVVTGYVRALSALRLLRRPSPSLWTLAPRFARSALWSMAAPRGDVAGWRMHRIGPREVGCLSDALPSERRGTAVFERSEGLFRHLLACPIVPMELYALERAGRVGGYVLLSYAPGQARLADCWMASDDPVEWSALVHSAVRQAQRKSGIAELVAWSSDPLLSQTLQRCGFHERLTLPIYFRGSEGLSTLPGTVHVQMLENDACYLYFGSNELWT